MCVLRAFLVPRTEASYYARPFFAEHRAKKMIKFRINFLFFKWVWYTIQKSASDRVQPTSSFSSLFVLSPFSNDASDAFRFGSKMVYILYSLPPKSFFNAYFLGRISLKKKDLYLLCFVNQFHLRLLRDRCVRMSGGRIICIQFPIGWTHDLLHSMSGVQHPRRIENLKERKTNVTLACLSARAKKGITIRFRMLFMRVLVVCNAIYIALHDESYQGAHSERAQRGLTL